MFDSVFFYAWFKKKKSRKMSTFEPKNTQKDNHFEKMLRATLKGCMFSTIIATVNNSGQDIQMCCNLLVTHRRLHHLSLCQCLAIYPTIPQSQWPQTITVKCQSSHCHPEVTANEEIRPWHQNQTKIFLQNATCVALTGTTGCKCTQKSKKMAPPGGEQIVNQMTKMPQWN